MKFWYTILLHIAMDPEITQVSSNILVEFLCMPLGNVGSLPYFYHLQNEDNYA